MGRKLKLLANARAVDTTGSLVGNVSASTFQSPFLCFSFLKVKGGLEMTKKLKTSLELAQEHWAWLHNVLDKQREMERKLFTDAFIHGYKHGKDSK